MSLRLATRIARPARPLTRSLASSCVRAERLRDPFPLPFDPALAEAAAARNALRDPTEVVDGWELPPPLDRTGEQPAALRARLIYQTRKRGILETDLLLSTFARDFLPAMSVDEMQQFDKLLDEPDWDIYYWAIEKRPAPERWAETALLAKLRKHARNEGRVVRLMPNLEDIDRK
ncbi:hypothetical protein CspeluHIS016_0700350 [Cutaneotrichosporon spelunceum]|uniref:Succinate dehydrogenase assembly factor 2, mitochondrial n=1 Tax=Cutaneotrichosporon spelunceum TaxID=1672016 RepID=A0AAD3TYX7_9TREE|nr:hypothetical protein CspeluHIS016_0700350 [Cutaneotrichosporon spelunceum]